MSVDFAGAIRTDQAEDFSITDTEVDMIDDKSFIERLRQATSLNDVILSGGG